MKGDEPAFPKAEFIDDPAGLGRGILHQGGLTKREMFAAMAMQGILASGEYNWILHHQQVRNEAVELHWAGNAIRVADALLAELEKERE